MLKRAYRLRDRRSVARVYRHGRTVRGGPLSARVAPNQLDHSRLAVVVSKKVAKSAPARNRIRRRLFESARRRWAGIQTGHDIIISVYSAEVKELPAAELEQAMDQLLDKARVTTSP